MEEKTIIFLYLRVHISLTAFIFFLIMKRLQEI